MSSKPVCLVAAAMRDEGPFLLEWVAWYRMLGFEILVATNDCTDPTPAMLNRLHDAGLVTHITHSPAADMPPKRSAHRAFRMHPLVASAEWLLICDVDEFLVIHQGDGTVHSLVAGLGDVHGVGVHWRVFGTGGATMWQNGLQHRMATRAAPQMHPANTSFKSLIHWPTQFDAYGAHSPRGFTGPGMWGTRPNVWVDSSGRVLGRYHPNGAAQRATAPDRVTHKAAQMNHYVLRNPESFELKRGIPSPAAFRDRYTDAFYEKFDRNEERDESALAYATRFEPILAEILALPDMARLHHQACAHYIARLCVAHSADPKEDKRYQEHKTAAEQIFGQ